MLRGADKHVGADAEPIAAINTTTTTIMAAVVVDIMVVAEAVVDITTTSPLPFSSPLIYQIYGDQ